MTMQPFNSKGPPLNPTSLNHLPETEALIKHLGRHKTKISLSDAEEVNQNDRIKTTYQNFLTEAAVVNQMNEDSEKNVDDPNVAKICKAYQTSDGVIVISHNMIHVVTKKVYLLSVEEFCAIDAYPRLEGNVITPLGKSGRFKEYDMLFFQRHFSYDFNGKYDGKKLVGNYKEGKTKKIFEKPLKSTCTSKKCAT